MRELTHLSLFTGIGGLDLAAEWAGFKTVGQCEWADYPTKVLEKHWPDVPRWRDIRTLNAESFYEKTGLRTVDVVSGGFPCQPFSVAGKRQGKDDDRYLWPEMLRVIREIQPAFIVGENVAGIVRLALDTVLSDLESEGYAGQAFIVPACCVDAPHRRDRVCILAHTIYGSGAMRRHRELQNAAGNAGCGDYHGGRTAATVPGERRENESRASGMADGLRTAVYETDTDADSNGLSRWVSDPLFPSERLFAECACRERERERERGYDGLLRSLAEVSPYGRIGYLNPEWEEWLMGYPIGWSELNV